MIDYGHSTGLLDPSTTRRVAFRPGSKTLQSIRHRRLRFADGKNLAQISSEVKVLGQKAKDKKLQPAEWEGNTFTISNLGMFGIEEFPAIINPPDACILAVGGIKQVAVVKNGLLVPGNVMKVCLSCDHRVVDGASGAAVLQTLKNYLEKPVTLFI